MPAALTNDSDVERYVAAFDWFPRGSAGRPAIEQLRRSAIAQFRKMGWPAQSHEEWKFTNIAPILKLPFRPVAEPDVRLTRADIEPFSFGAAAIELVFVNGFFDPALSSELPDEARLQIINIQRAIEDGLPDIEEHLGKHAHYNVNPFTALNTAFFSDGAMIVVRGKFVETPIHLLFVSHPMEDGAAIHPRNLIVAGPNSHLKVVENYVSSSELFGLTNAVSEIVIGDGAQVEHCKLQQQSMHAFHVAAIQAKQARGSGFTSHSLSLGARIARNDIHSRFEGEGGECTFNGLYLGANEQLVDHHTLVDHAKPNCASHEFYHGVLDGHSRGVFNGKIFVRHDAQKTNAKQTNRNLLLSENAIINTKPQLEIFADDVKCTHGATVGQLDANALFYLRSRGIGEADARRMLIFGFIHDVIDRIAIEPVRRELDEFLLKRFSSGFMDRAAFITAN